MQHIIQEIQLLTTQLQSENRHILKLIQQLSQTKPTTYTNIYYEPPSKQCQRTSSIKKKSPKLSDSSIVSRISNQTVKQSSQRCKSSQSIKHSRVTEKQLSISRKKLNQQSLQKLRKQQTQSTLSRLKKISQKTMGKISSTYLLKKKSKIHHFQTHL